MKKTIAIVLLFIALIAEFKHSADWYKQARNWEGVASRFENAATNALTGTSSALATVDQFKRVAEDSMAMVKTLQARNFAISMGDNSLGNWIECREKIKTLERQVELLKTISHAHCPQDMWGECNESDPSWIRKTNALNELRIINTNNLAK